MSEQMAPVVETSSGRLRGTVVEGVAAFKAIPYAAPPTGARRFLPPAEVKSWSGVRDADGLFGPFTPGWAARRHSSGA